MNRVEDKKQSVLRRVLAALGSMKLAVLLLSLLLILTYFGTIEQQEIGLYQAQKRYFDSWFLVHDLDLGLPGRDAFFTLPLLLPGAYLVSAVLFVNLLIGGVVLMRKGIRKGGILISHLGILFLLLAGVVAHHKSRRAYMVIYENERSNVAVEYFDPQIEITELDAEGNPEQVHVLAPQHFQGLTAEANVLFRLENLPFDLRITNFQENARPASIHEIPPPAGIRLKEEGQYYLLPLPRNPLAEANNPACLARLVSKEGKLGEAFILFDGTFFPKTVTWEGKNYFISLERERWVLPFTVALDRFNAEFYPGTMRPKAFESFVRRIDNEGEHPVHIQMNKPMRAGGLIFYQADWGPKPAKPGQRLYSKLEVVSNPADKWPEYALWLIATGLAVHFGWMLVEFILRSTRKQSEQEVGE